VIGAVIALEMAAVLMAASRHAEGAHARDGGRGRPAGAVLNTKALGVLMYTKYLYPLEIAAVILLVAMIAAIALTLREAQGHQGHDAAQP
jgi:NADH-quinone oxidoreductase subunit J